jgi:hypothetical protein
LCCNDNKNEGDASGGNKQTNRENTVNQQNAAENGNRDE